MGGVNLTLLEACDLEEDEVLGGWTGEKGKERTQSSYTCTS